MDDSREQTPPESSATTTSNRRVAERHRVTSNRPCQFITWPDCRGRRATLFDVSNSGVAIILGEPLDTGRDIMIRVPPTERAPGRTLFGKVAHVMPLADGSWRIGCALAQPLSEAEIAVLL